MISKQDAVQSSPAHCSCFPLVLQSQQSWKCCNLKMLNKHTQHCSCPHSFTCILMLVRMCEGVREGKPSPIGGCVTGLMMKKSSHWPHAMEQPPMYEEWPGNVPEVGHEGRLGCHHRSSYIIKHMPPQIISSLASPTLAHHKGPSAFPPQTMIYHHRSPHHMQKP